MKYLLLIIALLFTRNSFAQPCYGIDVLALAKQNISMFAEELPSDMCIGFLQGTFGNAVPNMKMLLSLNKVKGWREHLANYTCIRNHNCENGELKITDYEALKARAIEAQNLHDEFPNIPCYVSPFLEYDVKDKAIVNRWFNIVKTYSPSCTPIASIGSSNIVPAGVQVEKHGNNTTAFSRSNDGQSFFDSDIEKYKLSGKGLVFAWWPRLNLRVSGEKFFTPPSQRKAKATRDEVQQAIHTLRNNLVHPPFFTSCPNGRRLNKNEIWKVRSEDFNGHDKRENKAVLIVKAKVPKFNIFNQNNKKIGYLKYYGAYSNLPGYYRYYIGNGSGQNPYQLMKDAGNEWVCLKNKKYQYLVSSIRRSGKYK